VIDCDRKVAIVECERKKSRYGRLYGHRSTITSCYSPYRPQNLIMAQYWCYREPISSSKMLNWTLASFCFASYGFVWRLRLIQFNQSEQWPQSALPGQIAAKSRDDVLLVCVYSLRLVQQINVSHLFFLF
jgi:hypothetical protein